MGTWGPGNLDNDAAQDILADICQGFFKRVMELLQHPRAHEFDEVEFDELFVHIEMIFALSTRKMINAAPKKAELEPLFEPYLQRWENYFRENDMEPPSVRKSVIQSSFARLAEIADQAP
jgi:hypothetical protein